MNNQINDMIDCVCKYFNRIDLLMFSHTNKRFRKYSQKYLLKNVGKKTYCKIRTIGYIVDKNVILCASAAFEGYLNILMYLIENKCGQNYYDICYNAAYNGHLEILKWIQKRNICGKANVCGIHIYVDGQQMADNWKY